MRSQYRILLIAAILMCTLFVLPVSAISADAVNWYTQGNTQITSRNYTDAVVAFDHAISLEPTYIEAWNGKADALNRAHNYTEAFTASDKVIALDPNYLKGWINRGYILYNLGRYSDELAAYEQAIACDPSSAEAWFNKGYALGGLGRWQDALSAFDRVERLDPTYPNLAANQNIARQSLDGATPFYIRQAPVIGVVTLFVVIAVVWVWMVKKKN